jgi:Flp pilus assembly pilin Flp
MRIAKSEKGQLFLEYSLIIAVFVLVIIATVPGLRDSIRAVFSSTSSELAVSNSSNTIESETQPPLTSLGSNLSDISGSMIDLINQYYAEHGRYPRTWEPYSYTDLGLTLEEWQGKTYGGIIYKPGGSQVAIVPGTGYAFRIKDMNGNMIEFPYSYHWGLVYSIPNSNTWHFKRNDGTIVDIDTLEVITVAP